ncbi:MAG: ergothioneine biosynthesis protein EgtB [Leptolyngbyaceae cyanobacterium SL_1_1]|nr:ergothioneine biosynthesis protein EgtB [Leptolyngbyaceae cyanobacterium RM1_1_2]NJO11874.1 ergothioneine biosynthesis protein EgtB [Leptolyngbyaceae cyanobacterium SL_1_1]
MNVNPDWAKRFQRSPDSATSSTSGPATLDPNNPLRSQLQQAYSACRTDTLALVADLENKLFYQQAHPDFSPVGWHLGHIGFTESLWILEHLAQRSCIFPQYRHLFAADSLPKAERQNLPNLETLLAYLETLRAEVLDYLAIAPLAQQGRLWCWLLQHESQHYETMAMVLEMHRLRQEAELDRAVAAFHPKPKIFPRLPPPQPSIPIPAGTFEMGCDEIEAIDNEQPAHLVCLEDFYIDPYPVTQKEYQQFIAADGYQTRRYWSEAGWQWLQQAQVKQPLYWRSDGDWRDVPVCGVSWYEAEAYTRFVGKRLPTEPEWEKAVKSLVAEVTLATDIWGDRRFYNDSDCAKAAIPTQLTLTDSLAHSLAYSLGQVWEWTASWFSAYDGFSAYPYQGYSETYFDGCHRVLRGGSWATRPWARRSTFRNWYQPHVRQAFTGFRCVSERCI